MSSAIRRRQERYFEILEDYFGIWYKRMKEKNKSFKEIANEVLKVYSKSMANTEAYSFTEELIRLWEGNLSQLRNEVKELPCLKAYYSGRVSPKSGPLKKGNLKKTSD